MKTEIKSLPESIKAALKSVEFHGSMVSVEVVPDCMISPHCFCCNEGNRSFTLLVNMGTGESKAMLGSFGGSNPYTKTIVDDFADNEKFQMPSGCAVIKGEVGYTCYATLYLRPDNVVPGLLSASTIDEAMFKALCPHRLIGSYKADAMRRISAEATEAAIKAGFLAKKGRGLGLTVSGKNAIEKFEKENPSKRMW